MDSGAFASVLTVGPGAEFYESFGHIAIRICDSLQDLDIVFNYGSFDFSEPHFYYKFASSQLNYFVMPQSYAEFIFEYQFYGRSIYEQRLLLSYGELDRLFRALIENLKPENMYYRYDIFRDNCATRVHNIIMENVRNDRKQGRLRTKTENITIRDLIYKYTAEKELWWRFGVDVVLGARCDRRLTTEQLVMMPLEMMAQYDTMLLSDGRPLTGPTVQLSPQTRFVNDTPVSPTLVFLLLFIIVLILSLMAPSRGWSLRWLDGILFGAAALISLLILFLWFGSNHWCAKWNFNILWANPMFFWLLFRLRKDNKGIRKVLLACMALVALMWFIGFPQSFSPAIMLIVMTLTLRLLKIENLEFDYSINRLNERTIKR